MILQKAHLLLFSPFYREVGKKRKVVFNLKGWLSEVEKLDGKDDVFTSVYPLNGVIDKIFIDIDDRDLGLAFYVAKKIYSYLLDNHYTVIPVATGKKGFQLHILLEPLSYDNNLYIKKTLLANATYYILHKAGLYSRDNGLAKQIDTHVIGDVRRLCRVPGTLRPPTNQTYCVFLPINFDELSLEKIIELTKKPVSADYDYKIDELPTLHDFPKFLSHQEKEKVFLQSSRNWLKIPTEVREYLKRLLRPCIFYNIIVSEPRHDARVAATIDLLLLGYSIDEIVEIFSKLNWVDFNEEFTRYQVQQIKDRHYKPYGCRKLRKLFGTNYCENCKYRW